MKPNISDVAKAAGVSISMVSRVLTGRGYVREDKKRKVEKIVQELGYHPSALARGLRDKRTRTLGLLFSWLSGPTVADYFYREILSAVVEVCAAKGYQLLISNFIGRWDEGGGHHARRLLNDARVEGLLLLAPRAPAPMLVEMLNEYGVRSILLCHNEKELSFVDADQAGGMEMALDYLVARGHKRIGFLAGEAQLVSNAAARQKAFSAGMRRRGLSLDAGLLRKGRFDRESGFRGMRELLAMKQPPSAVVACSDWQAIGAMDFMRGAGLKKKPSLISFDDRAEASDKDYQLTTLRQPFYQIAKTATEEMITSLDEKASKKVQITLPMELIRRQSA
ncbi:MAG: LacI family DNA-binding transcriptional regulator [candidate division FCPU426 bacterium]